MAERPPIFSLEGRRVWVAGHNGMVGSALVRRLERERVEVLSAGRSELDLLRQADVEAWIRDRSPDVVIVAAAKVGGILANDSYPAEFLYENLTIETNVIHSSWRARVRKLLFLGSSCIYPKAAPQPMPESALLTGLLEPTNQWYAVAKITGIKLCQAYRKQYGCDFISAMPTNLYGPGDNFDLMTSHVLPALMIKIHQAKSTGAEEVEIWGSGQPRREFLHVDDCADAQIHLLKHYSDEEHINVGCGKDVTITELANLIARIVGYRGTFVYDRSKPDGTPRKLLDIGRIKALGWQPSIGLEEGIARTYEWYLRAQAGILARNPVAG